MTTNSRLRLFGGRTQGLMAHKARKHHQDHYQPWERSRWWKDDLLSANRPERKVEDLRDRFYSIKRKVPKMPYLWYRLDELPTDLYREVKERGYFWAWTDMPLEPEYHNKISPINRVKVTSYDTNKYVMVIHKGERFEIKSGYIYSNPVRAGDETPLPSGLFEKLPETRY